jgi:predicted GIY-YIG superfamily endonuclease
MAFYDGSINATIQHTNTQVTYTRQISDINTHITQNNATKKQTKKNKENQISSQSYTNSERNIITKSTQPGHKIS